LNSRDSSPRRKFKNQAPTSQNGAGDGPRKVQFLQLRKLRDLGLDLRSGRGHTDAHIWSRYTHTPNWIEIHKTFCGRTDGRTDTPEFQSTRSSAGDDLKTLSRLECYKFIEKTACSFGVCYIFVWHCVTCNILRES